MISKESKLIIAKIKSNNKWVRLNITFYDHENYEYNSDSNTNFIHFVIVKFAVTSIISF